MKIGLHIGKFDWPGSPNNIGEKLVEIVKTADEMGFYSFWVMDHLFQLGTQYGEIHGPVETSMLEGYCTISYLAAVTQRIKVGLLVTCNFFRHPSILVKIISTIDVLSGGRAYLGIGAGWFEREAKGLGIPFPSMSERFERLEEILQIAKQMWSEEIKPFERKHFHLAEPLNSPQPLSKPHPPILIGGGGEKKTLRLVAKYADAWNLVIGSPLADIGVLYASFDLSFERIQRKLTILKQHCDDIGRDFDEIEKTIVTYIKLTPGDMNASDIISLCHNLGKLGIQHVIFNMPNVHELDPIRIIGEEVIPQVKGIE